MYLGGFDDGEWGAQLFDQKQAELLKLMKSMSDDSVMSALREYIGDKRLHSKYISFIAKLAEDQNNEISRLYTRGKMFSSAMFAEQAAKFNVTHENWFWFARFLSFTEDDETSTSCNLVVPAKLLKKISNVLNSGERERVMKGRNDELIRLVKLVDDLMVRYKDYFDEEKIAQHKKQCEEGAKKS